MDTSVDCSIVVDPAGASHLAAPSSPSRKAPSTTTVDRSGTGDVRLDASLRDFGPSQCVFLRLREDGVRFSFCQSGVHPMAMSAAIARLFELRPARVHVSIFEDVWKHRKFGSLRGAVQYLVDESNAANVCTRQSDFCSRPLERGALAPDDTLFSLTDAWASGVRQLGALQEIDRDANSRLMVITNGEDPIVTIGEVDVTGKAPHWSERPSHFRLRDWLDAAFGCWVAHAYKDAWNAAQPRLEALDCIVKWPGRLATRYTYHRLILPCFTASGAPALFSVVRDDARIDLRASRH
jgi:hypothetical protein